MAARDSSERFAANRRHALVKLMVDRRSALGTAREIIGGNADVGGIDADGFTMRHAFVGPR